MITFNSRRPLIATLLQRSLQTIIELVELINEDFL